MVGPFIIKIKVSFPVIEIFIKDMEFQTTNTINYDPHHIISIRNQVNKNNPFEHQDVEGLVESVNKQLFLY